MANEDTDAGSTSGPNIPRWAVIGLILLGAAIVLFLLLRGGDRPPDVWAEATVSFDPACTENCTTAGELGSGAHGGPGIEFRINPAIDDPIAQWGDCLQSVFVCLAENGNINASPDEKATTARNCVSASSCPAPCLERYASLAAGSPAAAAQAFEDVFIGENAWCLPAEGRL